MTLLLELQNPDNYDSAPDYADFERWASASWLDENDAGAVIRIVGEQEIREMNNRFRGKDASTNVLSFPADLPDHIDIPLLGDLIICADVVRQEAIEQHKALSDHWAHMLVHGTLHLLGYDHIEDGEADEMEALEIIILNKLGVANPYLEITQPLS